MCVAVLAHGLVVLPLLVAAMFQDTAAAPGPAVQAASSCARCHSNAPAATAMRDAQERRVAPHDLWRGSLMANAARDPFWRATVSAEVAATPARRAEIEATCLRCHAPMAHHVGLDDHDTGTTLHVLECEEELGAVARDGVSCTVCHGMSPTGLGTSDSFSANYRLDDRRRLFGPHAEPFAMPMRHHTGFTPTQGEHILSSALCGSCHTLETDAYEPEGEPVGARLLEQAPYLEWRNSDYNDEGETPGPRAASCADCHAPTTDVDGEVIETRIARNPGGFDFPPVRPRQPYGRHLFVGGNTLVPALMRDHHEALGALASPGSFQAVVEATRDQLTHRTARVTITGVRREGATLTCDVEVVNRTGHKLPTGHPSRRAWLRLIVRDAAGAVLFASGATDASGRILGSDGRPLPSEVAGGPIEPHRARITSSDAYPSYEAVMADAGGAPTHTLMRGAGWFVDDRLLPAGWNADHPEAHRTSPIGLDGDTDFAPGRDTVHYEIAGLGDGPVTVEAALLYQSLGARWIDELFRWDTPEIARFRALYDKADRTPDVLAEARWP